MSFINRKETRARILGSKRAKVAGLTRVSDQYLNRLESMFINMVDRHVERHPSKGKTFQPYNII